MTRSRRSAGTLDEENFRRRTAMRAIVQDREALLSMLPVNTAAYLHTHGWQETHKEPGRYSIWSRSGGSEEPQILLPLSRDFEDYAIRASEVLAAIEQVEDR